MVFPNLHWCFGKTWGNRDLENRKPQGFFWRKNKQNPMVDSIISLPKGTGFSRSFSRWYVAQFWPKKKWEKSPGTCTRETATTTAPRDAEPLPLFIVVVPVVCWSMFLLQAHWEGQHRWILLRRVGDTKTLGSVWGNYPSVWYPASGKNITAEPCHAVLFWELFKFTQKSDWTIQNPTCWWWSLIIAYD